FIRIQNNEPEYHWVKASDLILYSQFSNINGDSFVKEQIGCDANLSFLGLFEGNREELRACKKDCGNQYPAYFGQWTERRDCKTSCKAKWDLDQSQIISDEDMPSGYVPPSNQGSGANGNTNNQSTTNNTNTQTTTGNTGTTGGLPTPTHTRINDELSNNSEAERFNEKDWEEETTKDNKTNTETKENKIPSTGTNAALKYGIITLLSIGALVGVYFMFFRNKGKGKSTAKTTV
ncbi:MAG: hypothetical protein Q7R95_04830, partial [bacterium]|nr:hypothetical protein [bacterium]